MKQKILQMMFGSLSCVARRAVASVAFFVAFVFSNNIEAANTYAATLVRSSSQFFSATDSPSLSITGDLTIEAWIKLASQPTTGSYTIVSKSNENGLQQSFALRYFKNVGVNVLDAWIYANGIGGMHATVPESIPTEMWTHVAMVYSASAGAVTFYVNGVQVGAAQTGLPNSIYDGTASLLIGGYDGGVPSTLFDGEIDDVRLWAVARTQQQISSAMFTELLGTEPNLCGYWKLNNSLSDSTTNGNTLVNNNSATFENIDLPFWSIPLIETNRAPTTNEIGQPTIPTDPTHFKVFTNGVFTNGIPLDPNKTTIVLTHGWNSSPSDWAIPTANLILANLPSPAPNVVVWDWTADAKSGFLDLGKIADKTPGEGWELSQELLQALGANYSKPIHFIGHSLGTLVNGAAAQYLQENGYSWTNMQMTLFDEAEVAWGFDGLKWKTVTTLATLSANFSTPESFFNQPLPKQFAWADNYVSAFGVLHPEAANVILTNGFPATAPDPTMLYNEVLTFHDYPYQWYDETIQTDVSTFGFRCSFERGGFAGAPATDTVYIQAFNGSQWNLVQTNFVYGNQLLDSRFQKYLDVLGATALQTADNIVAQAEGQVTGTIDNVGNMIVNLFTSIGNIPLVQNSARPLGGPIPNGGSANDTPAYAWIPLTVPSNTISMSFNFMLQGNGNNDSFQAALNGTNVLSLETVLIQTNVTMNSGLIDVSQYAGTNVELFLGIVGGTSTNAQLTVSDIQFYSAALPSLHAQASGNNFVLSWPLSAADYTLENSTDLISWTTNTDVSAIVNLQNTITNSISGGARFYRLKK
jgi:pimeloyl-ACP methyl ester carboxylesterase